VAPSLGALRTCAVDWIILDRSPERNPIRTTTIFVPKERSPQSDLFLTVERPRNQSSSKRVLLDSRLSSDPAVRLKVVLVVTQHALSKLSGICWCRAKAPLYC